LQILGKPGRKDVSPRGNPQNPLSKRVAKGKKFSTTGTRKVTGRCTKGCRKKKDKKKDERYSLALRKASWEELGRAVIRGADDAVCSLRGRKKKEGKNNPMPASEGLNSIM